MPRVFLFLALLILSSSSRAAALKLDVIDVASCRWWWLWEDIGTNELRRYVDEIPEFAALEKRRKMGEPENETMLVGYETRGGRREDSLACVYRWPARSELSEIECFGDRRRPLSGVVFRQVRPTLEGKLPVFECIKNCAVAAVKRIFEVPYEGDETGQDLPQSLYALEAGRFEKKCGR